MLYIFLVDTGTMLQLEMDLALETVSFLKGVLAQHSHCRIPPEKQVLLISGGESLDADERVCKYNAGTDTNPIFLFSLLSIESVHPPEIVHSNYDATDEELEMRARNSLMLPDAQSTVSVRASIAQDYVRASYEQIRICETLIHDQHLQHQGWQAVVANLEDTGIALEKRRDKLCAMFRNYLGSREEYREMVDTFDDDVAILHRIPVFSSLLEAESSESMVGSVIPNRRYSGESLTLLEWINSRGSSQSLEQVADSCYRSIEKLDAELLEDLSSQVSAAVESSKATKMKEIRGLSERLQGLEQILLEARRLTTEQQELAQAFLQNQQRASGLRDNSILPDLCASHKQQLMVMCQNYQKIASIRKRCEKAKDELSANLHYRMKWVVKIQDTMMDKGQLTIMYMEELRRLNSKLHVIEQLHAAPSMYIATAVEVVRRKAFSDRYLLKANALSENFYSLYEEELKLRKNFQSKLKRHFLSKMFPGMDDFPPAYATQRPDVFDERLPTITLSDVALLRQQFPDLAKSLQVPEDDAFANLLAKSINQTLTKEDDETLLSLQNMSKKIQINSDDIGSMSVMHKLMHDNGGRNKKGRVPSKMQNRSGENGNDSETDTDDITERVRSANGARRRKQQQVSSALTQSLPLDSSMIETVTAAAAVATVTNGFNSTAPHLHQSESFEFRVDKSIDPSCSSADPSSSSGGNTGNDSSVAPSSSSDGSVMKQTGEESTLMLQYHDLADANNSFKSLEERNAQIVNLNHKLSEAEANCGGLKANIQAMSFPSQSAVSEVKSGLTALREQILREKANFNQTVTELKTFLAHQAASIQSVSDDRRVIEQEERTKLEKQVDKLKRKLDVESSKLDDSNKEVDIYRQQLQQALDEVERLKGDLQEAREAWKKELQETVLMHEQERDSLVQKLTVDHEFEMEALKESLKEADRIEYFENMVHSLKEELSEQHGLVDDLKRKTRIMENNQEEKFHQEKDKIVKILEAGFSQREKLAVQNCAKEMGQKHAEEIAVLEGQHLKALNCAIDKSKLELERILEEQRIEHKKELTAAQSKKEMEFQELLLKEKRIWEELKDKDLRNQADRLSLKAKSEVENLRSRFRIMQTAGAMDRSPSASESDMSLESPKSDVLDNIRTALVTEAENNLRSERAKWELAMAKLRDEHKVALENARSKERIRETAERQVKFNEALKKAVEEKDRQLKQMSERNKELETLVASQDVDAELRQRNERLEAELAEVRTAAMTASVYPLQQMPKEEQQQMQRSMLSPTSISVTSIDRGDFVMIVWSDEHNNFSVYHEGPMLCFLHSDSFETLGLIVQNGAPNKRHLTAEVVEKEYCQAKKSGNRFRVPQGTKFYRVKCRRPSRSDGRS